MAFSTQRAFQYVPFLNEHPQPKCPPMEGVRLKTYGSARDERAWARSDTKKAQYLIDLVSCRLYDDAAGDGLMEPSPPPCTKEAIVQIFPKTDKTQDQKKLLESLENEKEHLKTLLNESQESLVSLREENRVLNETLKEQPDSDLFGSIKKKIHQLRKLSKIDKNDENELLKLLDGLQKAEKSFNVQNKLLRRSVEELSLKANIANIAVEPETSKDVNYLQNEVDKLRKEVTHLRSLEERVIQKENFDQQQSSEQLDSVTAERDALREKCESFASVEDKIVEWKNEADHFKSFRKKACMALKQKDEQIQEYRERIEEVEHEFKEVIKCFKAKEQERETICSAYKCLKEENQRLKEEICRNNCDLKTITALQNQIQFLSNELCEKNCAIEQYDIQFQQLLSVIEGLQNKSAIDIRNIQDVDSQTYSENIEELAASTRATLDQISKELEQRQDLEAELAQSMAELETIRRESEEKDKYNMEMLDVKEMENQKLKESLQKTTLAMKQSLTQLNLKVEPDEDCLKEVARLNEYIAKMKTEYENEIEILNKKSTELSRSLENEKMKEPASGSNKSVDEINSLKMELTSEQDKNRQLKNQNDDLNRELEDCQKKVKAQQEEIKKLDQRTTELLCSSEANLKQVGKLVNDINNVQNRNENLQSVLGAVDYSETYKQEIEDLKKLLTEEKGKSKSEEEQKKLLQKELDQLKEKLATEKAAREKLEQEKSQLTEENSQLTKENSQLTKENSQLTKENSQLTKEIASSQKAMKDVIDNSEKAKKTSSPPKTVEKIKEDSENVKEMSTSKGEKATINNSENAKEMVIPTKVVKPVVNEQRKSLLSDRDSGRKSLKSPKPSTAGNDKTFRALDKEPNDRETVVSKGKTVSRPSESLKKPTGSAREKKNLAKLNQLQKLHEAARIAERNNYEKEIEGHRKSNELLKTSLTKLTSSVQNSSAAEFEKEMRAVLDNFVQEICKWRCETNSKKLTKLQEIAKRILEFGIYCLTYKDLVYLHQRMSEAALRLKPDCLSSSTTTSSSQRELMCCKCSGKICEVPSSGSKDNKMLLEKMLDLEREIQIARDDLRRSKQEKLACVSDLDQSDPETLRAMPKQIGLMARKACIKPKSSRVSYAIKEEEFQIPTKDRCG